MNIRRGPATSHCGSPNMHPSGCICVLGALIVVACPPKGRGVVFRSRDGGVGAEAGAARGGVQMLAALEATLSIQPGQIGIRFVFWGALIVVACRAMTIGKWGQSFDGT